MAERLIGRASGALDEMAESIHARRRRSGRPLTPEETRKMVAGQRIEVTSAA